MREISTTQKLQVATIIIVGILIFYAIGIATDFFANPMFSMFFIISYDTAHNIATSMAIVIAIALTIIALNTWIIKKRKTGSPQTHNKPAIHTNNTPNKTPTIITLPTNNQKISIDIDKYLESYKTIQKTQSTNQPIIQPTKQQTTQTPIQTTTQTFTQLTTDKKATTNQETTINKDKTTCPKCKKEFTMPLFSLDYSTSQPKLIRLCPYCDQPLYTQPKNIEEEQLWNKYVTNP